jgi:hypothetical protein
LELKPVGKIGFVGQFSHSCIHLFVQVAVLVSGVARPFRLNLGLNSLQVVLTKRDTGVRTTYIVVVTRPTPSASSEAALTR